MAQESKNVRKTATVTKCVFKREWTPDAEMSKPEADRKVYYYHELTMSDGTIGQCGSLEKYAAKFAEGTEVRYYIDPTTERIKIDSPSKSTKKKAGEDVVGGSPPMSKSRAPRRTGSSGRGISTPRPPRASREDSFLGFAFSYAKDMVIAGKTSEKDIKDLDRIARYIYSNIAQLLEDGADDLQMVLDKKI